MYAVKRSRAGEGAHGGFTGTMGQRFKVSGNTLFGIDPVGLGDFLSRKECVRLRQTEYIGDVFSSSTASTFNSQVYPLSPTNGLTFPWLSQIAANFEQYSFLGLRFMFRSTSSVFNATNQGLGTIIGATQYNANIPPTFLGAASGTAVFGTKAVMEQASGCMSCVASDSVVFPIDCSAGATPISELYTFLGTGTNGLGGDPRLSTFGNFQVSTNGVTPVLQNLGELWVEYDICLQKKQAGPGLLLATHLTASNFAITTNYTGGLVAGAVAFSPGSNINLTVTGTTITFPTQISSGIYLVQFQWKGTTGQPCAYPGTAFSNCTLAAWPSTAVSATSTGVWSQLPAFGTTTQFLFGFVIIVTGPAPSLTFSGGTLPTAPVGVDILITNLPSTMVS